MIHHKSGDLSTIELVDDILFGAIDRGASDIHLESYQNLFLVRYRIDGILYDQQSFPVSISPQILSRIKILAHLNTAVKRVPQDGKFHISYKDGQIDLRVSSFPSMHGEKVVIRILDRSTMTLDLQMLGVPSVIYELLVNLIHKQNGFVLVAGPTGSGKTTTLYAALAMLNTPQKNIITLEDPIEYNIAGITQGQIHPDVGFYFVHGIRSMLRQDPDVVMIGEIRDKETARSAIQAGLTGHMVLSTVHTNDAPSTIMRLMDMGIEPFLLNASLSGILCQRLVRKLCTQCRTKRSVTGEEKNILDTLRLSFYEIYESKGCEHCFGLGYKGRTGIFELLLMTNQLRSCIVQHPVFDVIFKQALSDGMQTLMQDAQEKVKQGIISLQELVRVVL